MQKQDQINQRNAESSPDDPRQIPLLGSYQPTRKLTVSSKHACQDKELCEEVKAQTVNCNPQNPKHAPQSDISPSPLPE